MQEHLQPLLDAVQRNCHISDARYAGDYSLCVYLLKMREYFRWEQGYAFLDELPEGDLGDWLRQREDFWQDLEDEPFNELPLNGAQYDPFDNDAINAVLNPLGLVYSGGLGNHATPHFFLATLGRRERHADFTLLVSANEFARDLTAPPAMARDATIFIRRESLRRMIWEKIEEWQWNRHENAMARVLRCFAFDDDPERALEAMTDALLDSVLLHEQGEVLAGRQLGSQWERMLAALPRSKTEFMVRAVRDNLADSLTTLPGLLQSGDEASLHFFFANLTSLRKHLSPALNLAYEEWLRSNDREAIARLARASKAHWQALAAQMLETFHDHPDDFAGRLQDLIENQRL